MVLCAFVLSGSVLDADNAKKTAKKQETKKECKKTDCSDKSGCTKTCTPKPGCGKC
jgi:hypothetical protein